MTTGHSFKQRQTPQIGFYYLEMLIAVFLITVMLVPAINALHSGQMGSGIHMTSTADYHYLISKLEEVQAQPFTELDKEAVLVGDPNTATAYSDILTSSDGRQISRQVYLSRYDGDNADSDNNSFSGVDKDLIWVKVELAGTALAIEGIINSLQ